MSGREFTLLSNASATGSAKNVPAGRYAWAVDGTFSGATVGLSMLSPDGVNFISVGAAADLTSEGAVLVELPGCPVKAVVTGSPSAIFASLRSIGD